MGRAVGVSIACVLLAACATGGGHGSAGTGASAASARFCDDTRLLDARQQDRLLRFAAIVREVLDDSAHELALVSRSGLDLSRFAIRFSHAGIAVRDAHDRGWSVRQLYYACDERRPRLYDQGVAGFLMNTDAPAVVHVSLVLLPRPQSTPLAQAARDGARALRLLASRYSAIAFPFSDRYQNCNQWVLELMAIAWGGLPDGDGLRARAQAWLAEAGYRPSTVPIDSYLVKFLGTFVPLLPLDDHPEDERYGLRLRTALPTSIEAFARMRAPDAERIELCHDSEQVVIRRGWSPIADGCRPAPGDRVLPLDG